MVKSKEKAVELLRQKADIIGRAPKKSDFEPLEVIYIKAYLGPWPRALEYAGLKEAKPTAAKPKKRNAGKNPNCILEKPWLQGYRHRKKYERGYS